MNGERMRLPPSSAEGVTGWHPSPDLPMVEGKDLIVARGGSTILDVPCLRVEEGEVLSLIGSNGAGKTTLLQTLSHLVKPFGGEVFFKGRKVGGGCPVLEYRRALAMVFQEPLLFDTTVFDNVASGLKLRGLHKSVVKEVVAEYLELFGILQLKDRSARNLSGGEAQRTSLARAFATKPEVIFLDEPFASLDPGSRELLIDDVQSILRKTKTTALLVTHDLMEALRLSDRIGVMDHGKIRQIDSAEEVMNRPVDEVVASFIGIGTVISGRVIESRGDTFSVAAGGREIESIGQFAIGETVCIYIRPENVTLSIHPSENRSAPVQTSARNVFSCTVTGVTPFGFYEKVRLDCGFPLVSFVTRQSVEKLDLREGRAVLASFKATAVHVMRKLPLPK
jgi:tungstate transport system ATP-binding protein